MSARYVVGCILVLASVVPAAPASAQAAAPARLGLGAVISDARDTFVAAGSGSSQLSGLVSGILVPIGVTPRFRLEPEVGLHRMVSTDDAPSGSSEQTTTSVRVGLGLFGLDSRDGFTLSYGARLGYLRSISTLVNPVSSVRTSVPGIFVAPAAGGEYALSDWLSLGAEVQIRFSRWKWTESGSDRMETSAATVGVLIVRFYLR